MEKAQSQAFSKTTWFNFLVSLFSVLAFSLTEVFIYLKKEQRSNLFQGTSEKEKKPFWAKLQTLSLIWSVFVILEFRRAISLLVRM